MGATTYPDAQPADLLFQQCSHLCAQLVSQLEGRIKPTRLEHRGYITILDSRDWQHEFPSCQHRDLRQ